MAKNKKLTTAPDKNEPAKKSTQQVKHKNRNFKQKKEKKNADVWFDDVDPILIRSCQLNTAGQSNNQKSIVKANSFSGLTRYIAMDCEMVGTGYNGTTSMLARVSLVNLYGHCVYDKYVKPMDDVTDYRTDVSGIRPENFDNAEDFKVVQQEVFKILENRILVGHAVHHDLKVLYLSHPRHMIRDTSTFFRRFFNNRPPQLRKLSENYLGVKIQDGEHDSVVDAQVTMRLYTLFKKTWEPEMHRRFRGKKLDQKTSLV